jgi:N-acyl-D-amino-acid deacylase
MTEFDLLIKDTLIIDGTGKKAFTGNIGIIDEKIAEIGDLRGDAKKELIGTDLITSPGFVDPHSHADLGILRFPLARNLVMQGITTFLGGACGLSMAPLKKVVPSEFLYAREWWNLVESNNPIPDFLPIEELNRFEDLIQEKLGYRVDWRTFEEFLKKVENNGTSINYAPLVGHSTVRVAVMGSDFKRTATSHEILEMKKLVEEAMKAGAKGFSCFFDPGPGEYASMDEMIALALAASRFKGKFFPHTRHIQSQWPSDDPEEYGYGIYHGPLEDVWVGRYRGYQEVIKIGRESDIPIHVAHMSNAYIIPQKIPEYLEKAAAKATLEIWNKAKQEGLDVTFDVIPSSSSIASQTDMIEALQKALKIKNRGEIIMKLKTAGLHEEVKNVYDKGRLKFGMVHTRADPYWMDCFKILTCKNKEYEGETIAQIAEKMNKNPLEALIDVLIEDPETKWTQFKDKRNSSATIPLFLKHPASMPCTDTIVYGQPTTNTSSIPPPIAYGLYPHYIDTLVKKEGALSLEEAIRKASHFPSTRFELGRRGALEKGFYADIVMFDLKKIRMMGSFTEPTRKPEGIARVIVNGKIVYENGAHTGEKSGKILRRN